MKTDPFDSIDRIAGRNLRRLRKRRGWSQERLARVLQVSFQQVQKYENGANRISAGRLFMAAVCLDAAVSEFFDGVGDIEG